MRTTLPGIALVVASMLPAAIGSLPPSAPEAAFKTGPSQSSTTSAKKFQIPMESLQAWAGSVVVTVNDVLIEGHSKVHAMKSDCELHFGAHSDSFKGVPDGLVLEPMNVCVQPFPGKTDQNNADWISFSEGIKNTVVTISGVPRIWPEHLSGGNELSNPNHAVEIHPLTSVTAAGQTFDFAPNVFAGDYEGGVKEPTALKIAQNTSVSVMRTGDMVEVSFRSGQIGNFTLLDIVIDRNSIINDGSGSFRMTGQIRIDDESGAPVRIVTAKGSPVNDEIAEMQNGPDPQVSMKALILFSLSPQALLDAANQSQGSPVLVKTPLQLILFGAPDAD